MGGGGERNKRDLELRVGLKRGGGKVDSELNFKIAYQGER